MPIILKNVSSIIQTYTEAQLVYLREHYIDLFRLRISDYDPEKNVLLGKVLQYSEVEVIKLLSAAMGDINGGYPKTTYTLFNADPTVDLDMICLGAIIFSLMKEGILQLRNQIDYSDSGLSIGMFNKTGAYQGWTSFMLQEYAMQKKEFKDSIIPNSYNAGFFGIGSEYSYRGSRW